MKFAMCLVLALLATASSASAQVLTRGPVDTSMKFEMDLPANMTGDEARTFEWRIKDGAIPLTALTGFTCAPRSASVISCIAPVGQSQADALNRIGVHSLTATLFREDVGESLTSPPFVLTSPAGAPTGMRLTR